MKEALSYLSGVLAVVGYIPYLRAILKGKTKPSKVTWIIWSSLDFVTLVGLVAKKALNGQIVGVASGGIFITLAAIKYGSSEWTRLDKFCLASGVAGIAVWAMTGDPINAILVSLTTVFIASLPTFRSAWNDPSHEDPTAWILFTLSSVSALIAIPALAIEHALQPIVFATINAVMVFLIFVRPRFLPKAA